jgi:antirestriction protein ArdC
MPSVYEIVTEKIIKQLESGVAPWRKPWTCQTPANLITQKEYRGLNVFTLASQGFPSRFWLTFNQATKLGGRIRKGEKSSPVIFWNVGEEQETPTQDGKKATSRLFLLRYYSERVQFVAGRRHRHPRVPPARDAHQRSHRNVRTDRDKHAGPASVRAIRQSVVLAD